MAVDSLAVMLLGQADKTTLRTILNQLEGNGWLAGFFTLNNVNVAYFLVVKTVKFAPNASSPSILDGFTFWWFWLIDLRTIQNSLQIFKIVIF